MYCQVRSIFCTSEADAAVHQMDDIYGAAFVRGIADLPLNGLAELNISLEINHPASGVPEKQGRGSYDKASGAYFITQSLDYADWIGLDWEKRVQGYAYAVKKAINRIARTRLTDEARGSLLDAAERVTADVSRAPPEKIVPLEPIHLVYTDQSGGPGLHFGRLDRLTAFTPPEWRYVEIPPKEAFAAAQALLPRSGSDLPSVSRVFKRDRNALYFYEAFPHEGQIAEHWGIAGVGGENRFHDYRDVVHARSLVAGFKKAKQLEGFRPVPRSRQRNLIVEYDIGEGCANPEEMDFRHAAQDVLDDLLGQTGLGYCDGGSSGAGTMEICLIVVDARLAEKTIRERLADTPYGGFQRIYVEG